MIRVTKTLRAEQLERRELLSVNTVDTSELSSNLSDVLLEFEVAIVPIDGVGNNVENPSWGATDTQLLRLTTVEYADGISEPAGEDRPSAREVSNVIAAQQTTETNDRYLTDLIRLSAASHRRSWRAARPRRFAASPPFLCPIRKPSNHREMP